MLPRYPMMNVIEKAQRLLQPITYEPFYEGYYLLVNGEDNSGETFCENCIDEQPKAIRKSNLEQRARILAEFETFRKTGKFRGHRQEKKYSEYTDAEIAKAKRQHLKDYPLRPKIEVMNCDPDFSGGNTRALSCDGCGHFFHTQFAPDLDEAKALLEDYEYSGLTPEVRWQLDIAFYHYRYLKKEAKDVLLGIAKKIIKPGTGDAIPAKSDPKRNG